MRLVFVNRFSIPIIPPLGNRGQTTILPGTRVRRWNWRDLNVKSWSVPYYRIRLP